MQQPGEWDLRLWGDGGHEGSVYLHRLAVRRDYAGGGLGTAIMDWALQGIDFPGKTRMRLDCIADNPGLNAFYLGLGYSFMGETDNGFCLYEKPLS